MGENILTVKKLAKATGLPVRTIYDGIREGLFPAFQIRPGGKYLINYDEFQTAVRNLSRQNLQRGNEESNVVSISGIRKIRE